MKDLALAATDLRRSHPLLPLVLTILAAALFVAAPPRLCAQDSPAVGIVSHIKVLSDKVEDVSSVEAWKNSWIKPGMSDQEKCLAIWKTFVKYRHQDEPPNEFLQGEKNVHEPFKTIHVYGYNMCCCASCCIEGMARYLGYPARGRIIALHSVPEVWYDNSWHLLDASLMSYFFNKDNKIASVDEIRQSILDWRKDHPDIFGDTKLREFSKNGGWKNGPAVLATCTTYDKDGINQAGWHGWWSNMQEYNYKINGKKIVVPPDINGAWNVYDYGAILGYELNVQLREGEKLIRNWFNKGLHINMDNPKATLGCLKDRKALGMQKDLGDRAPGRVGNGLLEWNVPVTDVKYRQGALTADNLDAKAARVADGSKPGVLILRLPCSYVYLRGELNFKPVIAAGGNMVVSFSDNNGLDWKELAKVSQAGEQKIDLTKYVYRRYDYRVKFEMTGQGTRLDALKFSHDIQHSQAPLPLITEGDNTITFSAGPAEGTITIQGNMNPESAAGKQLLMTDFHPSLAGLDAKFFGVGDSGKGEAILPVRTPGEITRIRMSAHWRAREARDGYEILASFDNGATWKSMQKLGLAQPANSVYFTFSDIPAGAKEAKIKLAGVQRNTACLFDLRIDVDYKEPYGGYRPVKVTYLWDEAGQPRQDEHVCKTPQETWTLKCGPKTVAKSFTVELAK